VFPEEPETPGYRSHRELHVHEVGRKSVFALSPGTPVSGSHAELGVPGVKETPRFSPGSLSRVPRANRNSGFPESPGIPGSRKRCFHGFSRNPLSPENLDSRVTLPLRSWSVPEIQVTEATLKSGSRSQTEHGTRGSQSHTEFRIPGETPGSPDTPGSKSHTEFRVP